MRKESEQEIVLFMKLKCKTYILLHSDPVRNFFEIRRYFSKTAGNSADNIANLLRTADAP